MRTRVRRWRSGSGWSPGTASCAGGTGSSRQVQAPRRPSGCYAPIGSPRSPPNCPHSKKRSRWRVAERDSALAAMEQCRTAAEKARHAALAAERDARDATRAIDVATAALERIEAQRESYAQRLGDLEPVLDAAHEAVAAAERSLAAIARSGRARASGRRGRATSRYGRFGGRRQARRSRDQGARDRHRPRAFERRIARAGRLAQARGRSRAKARPGDRAAEAAVRRAVRTRAEPAELDVKIAELERSNNDSQVRIGEAATAEREAEEAVVAAAHAVSSANERSADTRERRAAAAARAEAQQARSAEFARTSVEKFECVPQRLPENLGFDAGEPRNADEEAATLERLTAERERIGPVNLVAEAELAELDQSRTKGAEEAEELTQAINRLRGSIGNFNREGRVRLLDAYGKSTPISAGCSRPCSMAARRT